jgi:hypothetical protein
VRGIETAVMVEAGHGENESEDHHDPTDDAGEQEQLFDAVIRSKPLGHGRISSPDVLVGYTGYGDYSGEFKKR